MSDREIAALTFYMVGIFIFFMCFKDARSHGVGRFGSAMCGGIVLFAVVALGYAAVKVIGV